MNKGILLSCILLGQVAIADNYKKIILSSFSDESVAQSKFNQVQNDIEEKIKEKKKQYPFNVVMRPSGSMYIIAVEPFKYFDEANEILLELKSSFPSAYINNNAETFDENELQKTVVIKKAEEVVVPVAKERIVVKKMEVAITPATKVTKELNNSIQNTLTLNEMLQELISTDPEIKEQLHQYKSIVEEINMSKSGYYPKVDIVGKTGFKTSDKIDEDKDRYDASEVTLSVVQNIFNGFGTSSAVNRDEARAKAAFNKYIEVAQDKMYKAIESYIKVLRYSEVLKIAKDNVKLHEETLLKIQKRYDEGFSTLSEVDRVRGRLALAKSNYVSETNNLYDSKYNFHKALGRFVNEKSLEKPVFSAQLPKRLEEAQDIAIHNNPSILVANNDIKVMQESLQYAKKNDYPTLDLELEANRYNNLTGSSDAREDDTSAMLVLRYNLYNGGSDIAEKQKYISLLNYEYEHKNTLKREVIESLGLSWNAHKMIAEQYQYQLQYRDLTNKTQEAYSEEFQLGRRTLIDLLDVQDELNSIKIKVIHSTYDLLFSKYRIMDATGELYKMFPDTFKENYQKDKILAYVDQDKDNILDVEDQCDNSAVNKTNIYGCDDINCIKVDKIEFNKKIGNDVEEVDTSAIETLWGVK